MTPATTQHSRGAASIPAAKYRPDIDGLRALAVLSVFLYHLDFPSFSGGFVGVDVFFVISGFLITRLIRDEHAATGTLSFRRFYVRRLRRLVPAQLFVSIVCTLLAALWLAPPHLKSYGGSLASAVTSVSNFFFWSQSGYFDTESSLKPLLHTWSLAVEEQFYLVWPAALLLALRARHPWTPPVLLLVAGVVSLALNQVFLDGPIVVANQIGLGLPESLTSKEWLADGRATIFYLLPFRVFEFAIGGALVWLTPLEPRRESISDAIVVTGLALIAYAVLTFDKHTEFPSFNALLPTVGAALCIHAGQARRCGLVLRNRAAVRIGLASYSLYLVHWPLIVFWGYPNAGSLSLAEKVSILVIALSTALFMLRWVEQPFRHPSGIGTPGAKPEGKKGTLPSLFAMAALLFAIGFNMWSEDGWAWRYSNTIVAEEMKFKADEFHKYVWKNVTELHTPFSDTGQPKMLIVGDSMAADFTNVALGASLDSDFEIRSIPIRDSCGSIFPLSSEEYDRLHRKSTCLGQSREVVANPNWERADVVIFAFLWDATILEQLQTRVGELRALAPRATFVLVGPKIQTMSGIDVLHQIARGDTVPTLSEYTTPISDLQRLSSHLVRTTAEKINVSVFDVSELFCHEGKCLRFNEFGNMLFYDNLHLTPKGAEFVGRRLRGRIGEYPYFQAEPLP